MASFHLNKGINKPVEFKGLKAQYLVYLAAGLLGIFLAFTVLYLIGVNLYGCTAAAIAATSLLFHLVFKWNRVYGEHGFMKKAAARRRPNYLISQGKYLRVLRYKKKR